MVSIRRRRLLGLKCPGPSSILDRSSKVLEQGQAPQNLAENTKPVGDHHVPLNDGNKSSSGGPVPLDDSDKPKEVSLELPKETTSETGPGSSNVSAGSSAPILRFPGLFVFKRRKRHRRKQVENQEPCIMRGVYYKNLKWQAAIKVDKKQIHLGTVGSQEEAARLYDRAAFMCGREPNFDLSEEEKQELRQYNWEEFLSVTRSAITSKKSQRRNGSGSQQKLQDFDWEEGDQARSGGSASEDDTPDS